MLNIPNLGTELLNNALTHVAEREEDSSELESFMTVIETCKGLVGRTPLREGIRATALNHDDVFKRERDIVQTVQSVCEIVGMMES